MGVLRPGMGGKAPRKLKATDADQIECFEQMTAAAKTNDLENLQASIQQLEKLIPPPAREGKQFLEVNQAMKSAIREGHVEAAEKLLDVKGINPDDYFSDILSSEKVIEFFEVFERHGLRIDEVWAPGGRYPLWYDALPDKLDALEWLLAHGADANLQISDCETPLDRAAAHGSIDAIKFLLNHGADIEQSNVLHFAAGSTKCNKEDPEILALMDYLLNKIGIDVNAISTTDERDTALHKAVEAASRTRASFLLDHGADVTIEDDAGFTPLQGAVNAAKAKGGASAAAKEVASYLEQWVEKQKTEE